MDSIKFTTRRGANVEIANDGLHGPCLYVNDGMSNGNVEMVEDPEHGTCVATMIGRKIIVPIPAEHVEAVRAMLAAHTAAVSASLESAEQYDRHHARVLRGMGGHA